MSFKYVDHAKYPTDLDSSFFGAGSRDRSGRVRCLWEEETKDRGGKDGKEILALTVTRLVGSDQFRGLRVIFFRS